MSTAAITAAARALADAHQQAGLLTPFTTASEAFTLDLAYAAQYLVTQGRLAAGWNIVGRKIGFTNRSIWPLYGVDAPMWAPVFDRTVIHARDEGAPGGARATVSLARTVQPRIEPEILLRIRDGVPAGLTEAREVLRHVDAYAHSIEIVQSHFPGWKASLPDFCADHACHAKLIVGPLRPVDQSGADRLVDQLAECRVGLYRAGELMLEGTGSNALGHPLLALAHLADVLAAQGAPALAAGEIVSTGTLTDALPVAPGETWSTRFQGIGVRDLQIDFVS